MLNWVFVLIFISMSQAFARPVLIFKNSDSPIIRTQFDKAYKLFQSEIGEFNGTVTVSVNPGNCLRTGYDRKSKEVVFCPGVQVLNSGLNSIDVINHELFHAFLCSFKEDLCSLNEKDYLHEALADVFAYKLSPDVYFGENFYVNQSYIRKYITSLNPHLVQGEHELGNAMAGIFITERRPLKDYLELFSQENPRDLVIQEIEGMASSRLNRYRLSVNQVMKIKFGFPDELNIAQIVWEAPAGVEIEGLGKFEFSVKVTENPESSKTVARFYSEDFEELGRRTFYFGRKK